MGKQEFLEKLRTALSGRVSAEIVAENVRYYEDYINIEVRKGRNEKEVLEQLGDPRLIARTIIQTHGGTGRDSRSTETNAEAGSRGDGYGEEAGRRKRFFGLHMPGWLLGTVALVVFAAVLALVFAVVYSVASLLLPVLLIILAVSFVVKLFRDWLH